MNPPPSTAASSSSKKLQIEDKAAHNLARPLLFCEFGHSDSRESHHGIQDCNWIDDKNLFDTIPVKEVGTIPSTLLNNLEESFLTLFQARLRAYVTFLSRHGLALLDRHQDQQGDEEPHADGDAQTHHGYENDEVFVGVSSVEHKLLTLLDLANQVKIENVVTAFSIVESNTGSTSCGSNINAAVADTANIVNLPLTFKATLDVIVPVVGSALNKSKIVTLEVKVPGQVIGHFSDEAESGFTLTTAKVSIHSRTLMDQLMNKATSIASLLLECVTSRPSSDDTQMNISSNVCSKERPIDAVPRRAKQQAQQDYKKKHKRSLPSDRQIRTVSPDLSPQQQPKKNGAAIVPPLLSLRRTSISFLPAETCASIVDNVIPTHVFQVRPAKRCKSAFSAG
eukprot:CAMPEP_0202456846 /NCGR_PEP_ID=MMETSP1360-20130828/14010_1 /ASSEMBLY_ACC=CAM_ASM_000848 /TAXON_ID=515479 /ORGANISM="Licmophora paradoxa, Strain CCMP2313" /LENGTH=394 /DNA_ID=CAMNT_0049076781 /DNA_START=353 /DNA_END=1536 /DNA_ORIENTATION=+